MAEHGHWGRVGELVGSCFVLALFAAWMWIGSWAADHSDLWYGKIIFGLVFLPIALGWALACYRDPSPGWLAVFGLLFSALLLLVSLGSIVWGIGQGVWELISFLLRFVF